MMIKCPSCGAQTSLDVLVQDRAAADALALALRLSGGIGDALLRYLALHRPAKSALSMPRVAKLLSELLPAIQSQRIERNGQTYEAPPEAWAWAVESMLCARDAGRLQTPLKSHGYLYEVLSKWQATAPPRGGVGGACLERTDQDPLAPQMRPQSASKASDGMSFFRAREQALLQKINA